MNPPQNPHRILRSSRSVISALCNHPQSTAVCPAFSTHRITHKTANQSALLQTLDSSLGITSQRAHCSSSSETSYIRAAIGDAANTAKWIPSDQPSSNPTQPTGQPSGQPLSLPSCQPTVQPSSQQSNPTGQPTMPQPLFSMQSALSDSKYSAQLSFQLPVLPVSLRSSQALRGFQNQWTLPPAFCK
jgi:hypothetical protein